MKLISKIGLWMLVFPASVAMTICVVQIMLIRSLLLLPMNVWYDMFAELDEIKKN